MRNLALLLLLAGCVAPPPDAYITGLGTSGRPANAIDLGMNTVGEGCVQAASLATTAEIYCGAWRQPSARVRQAKATDPAAMSGLAASSPWRSYLDDKFICSAARPTTIGGDPALQLDCTRRAGGWPHVAVAVFTAGHVWLADGVESALPAVQRSIAVLSGRAPATPTDSAAVGALQAERQASRAREAGDVREYDMLMSHGLWANLADDSSAAENAYGAAMALEEKANGRDDSNVADPAMHLALQLSNQGRYGEANALFARTEQLAAKPHTDQTLAPRLFYFEALHLMNQGKDEAALALLRRAEAGYLAILPPDALHPQQIAANGSFAAKFEQLVAPPSEEQATALTGLVEDRRYQAILLRDLHRPAESEAELRSAETLLRNARLDQPELLSRLSRTKAISNSQVGNHPAALDAYSASNSAFARAYPDSRPLALVGLLRARELVDAGQNDAAIPICRSSIQVLTHVRSAFNPERMIGCLRAFAAVASATADPDKRQVLLRDMFLASQLVQSSTTSRQIQQASARLAEGSSNQKIGDAIRAQQDAASLLADIRRRRQALAEQVRQGAPVQTELSGLDDAESKAAADLAARESEVQAAAPNYNQLVQQATAAEDVLNPLTPDEAFVAITLTQDDGWTFLLRNHTVEVSRIKGGAAVVDPLVLRIRAAMTPETPAFDTGAGQNLFTALFGDLAPHLDGVRAMTVAPTGSLLSLPFGVLLTGPAKPTELAAAPWLMRKFAIGHVPSAGNFVALRKIAGTSKAPRPWFGFGAAQPVTLAQARQSFGAACGDAAELFAGLPPLPGARNQLTVAARLLGASPDDELVGPSFTAPAVQQVALANYRVLHFATHGVLPSDLKCQDQPALVTSAPRGAPDASGALLTASDLAQAKLDADLVILSACNSGGPHGALGGGESLSALARSFFYGGARSLLITHWDVNDQAAAFTVAETLRRLQAVPGLDVATALQQTQAVFLDKAGDSLPVEFAHPFYWAPFALIGPAAHQAAVNATLPDDSRATSLHAGLD